MNGFFHVRRDAAGRQRGVQIGVNRPLLKASSVASTVTINCPIAVDDWTKVQARQLRPQLA
jgi:hypothetical protein